MVMVMIMILNRLLCRARVTSWVSSTTRFKQCLTTSNSLPQNATKSTQKVDNERFQNHRSVLEFSRNVVILTCESSAESGVCDVYLVGTSHISQKSCQEVQAIINFLKPEVVFLELCSSRKAALKPHNLKIPTMKEMVDAILKKKTNLLGGLTTWMYAQIASELKVIPGSEFRVAYEEAIKYNGRVVLGDRPVQITLARAWGNMSLWQKTKLMLCFVGIDSSALSDDIVSKLRKGMISDMDMDLVTLLIQELGKRFPTLMEALVHERDLYMSSKLLEVACKSSCIVAVVGKGHLPGITKHWKQPVEVKDLLTIPPP